MSSRMNWVKLLSTKRVSELESCSSESGNNSTGGIRSAFEIDWDQIIYSYPFRRLQDKTQVIPFPKYDFVHTRLTHSLEVASIGRSLGKMAAEKIFEESKNDIKLEKFLEKENLCPSDIGTLVGAACLAHDIGNPPFGHSGEDAISHFFKHVRPQIFFPHNQYSVYVQNDPLEGSYVFGFLNTKKIEEDWPDSDNYLQNICTKNLPDPALKIKKIYDFVKFEGNANGFRILTKNCKRGINPTMALLGTFTKYPRDSFLMQHPFGSNFKPDQKAFSKYGFFQSEKNIFTAMAHESGLLKLNGISDKDVAYHRHPLSFLMEAADDIAYQMIDFEDGCRLGLIDYEKIYELESGKSVENLSPFEILEKIIKHKKENQSGTFTDFGNGKNKMAYLRAEVINTMAIECFKVFKNNYEEIMTGKFNDELIAHIPEEISCNWKHLKTLVKEYVYKYPPVLQSEASGFEVIGSLLTDFSASCSICSDCGQDLSKRDEKIYSLIPTDFRPDLGDEGDSISFEVAYPRLLKILDYVSGMTDNYAVSLYRKLKGIQLPEK